MGLIYFDAPFVSLNSASIVNRQLAARFITFGHEVLISPERGNSVPTGQPPDPSLKALLDRKGIPDHPEVTIRNSWPPDFTPAATGKLVVIQPWEFGSMPEQWLEPFSRIVDDVWVPSSFVREVYLAGGVPADKVEVVPSGIDPNIFRSEGECYKLKTKKDFKFLFVGGSIHRKGIDYLLSAYSTIFSAKDDVCLVIKDFGADSFYKNMSIRKQILDFIEHPGVPEIEYINDELNETDLAALYRTCDVLVHPYRGEGFGLPMLEAMACGTPPIVTGAGPSLDFCTASNSIRVNSSTRVLEQKLVFGMKTVDYPSLFRIDVDELKRKMLWASGNREAIRQLGANGPGYARDFWTWDVSARIADRRIRRLCAQSEADFRLDFRTATDNARPVRQTDSSLNKPVVR